MSLTSKHFSPVTRKEEKCIAQYKMCPYSSGDNPAPHKYYYGGDEVDEKFADRYNHIVDSLIKYHGFNRKRAELHIDNYCHVDENGVLEYTIQPHSKDELTATANSIHTRIRDGENVPREEIEEFRRNWLDYHSWGGQNLDHGGYPPGAFNFSENHLAKKSILSLSPNSKRDIEKLISLGFSEQEAYGTSLAKSLRDYKGNYVFYDIETAGSGFSAGVNDVIEFGGVTCNEDGEIIYEMLELYKPTEGIEKAFGNGAVDVHHITPDMNANSSILIEDIEAQQRIDQFLSSGIGVAHNGFNFDLPILKSSIKNHSDYIQLDSRNIRAFFDTNRDPKTKGSARLKDFVEGQGFEYVDAHRASTDSRMMANAFFSWKRKFIKEQETNLKLIP